MHKVMPTVFAIVMASGTALGQQELAEQLVYANEEQFTHIFPIGIDNSKLIEQVKRSSHLLTTAIERKLPPDATEEAKEELAMQQANAAVVLLRINQPAKAWPLLKHSPDPSARSYLIHRLGPLGVDANTIIKRLEVEPDITIRRALILGLGEFDEKALSLVDRTAWLPKLQEKYRTDPDPGIHAAAEWVLRHWKHEDWLKQVNEELAKDNVQRDRLDRIQKKLSEDDGKCSSQWYVTGQGQTMVVIPGPVEFLMGSPTTRSLGSTHDEPQHRKRIDWNFAISSKEVTVEQYLRFQKAKWYLIQFASTEDCPMNSLIWFDAVSYCNWLSEREGIPKEQWCYEPNTEGKYESGMTMTSDYLQRSGYRLPTEAEWEYACRAGSEMQYSFGEPVGLLSRYGWYEDNSSQKSRITSHPVGSLKPNDLGMFDMHGNLNEWCQNLFKPFTKTLNDKAGPDSETVDAKKVDEGHRVLRDGSFGENASSLISTMRSPAVPHFINNYLGFRPARTLSPSSKSTGRD